MKRIHLTILSVFVVMVFLMGCVKSTGEAFKSQDLKMASINKSLPKINKTNQTIVRANATNNITKINATLNTSRVNVTNVSVPRLNISRNITSFNVTSNYTKELLNNNFIISVLV